MFCSTGDMVRNRLFLVNYCMSNVTLYTYQQSNFGAGRHGIKSLDIVIMKALGYHGISVSISYLYGKELQHSTVGTKH